MRAGLLGSSGVLRLVDFCFLFARSRLVFRRTYRLLRWGGRGVTYVLLSDVFVQFAGRALRVSSPGTPRGPGILLRLFCRRRVLRIFL